MITIEEFNKLKGKVDAAKTQIARDEGAYDNLLKKLKEDYDVESLEEARTMLKEMEEKKDKLESEVTEQLAAFNTKWDERFSG
jgi:hypothetical protein